jgi:hypothetical protein
MPPGERDDAAALETVLGVVAQMIVDLAHEAVAVAVLDDHPEPLAAGCHLGEIAGLQRRDVVLGRQIEGLGIIPVHLVRVD